MAAAPLEPTSGGDHRHPVIAADSGARPPTISRSFTSHRDRGASAKLVISADVDPLRSVRCQRPAPAAVVVIAFVIKDWRAYESKARMAEKFAGPKGTPRRPVRELGRHKMRPGYPSLGEARAVEMRPSAHSTDMH